MGLCILSRMIALLLFLLVLSVLVLIHEFGHYFAARFFGVKAEEFGFGFPPRAVGFVKVDGKWVRIGPGDRRSFKQTIWSVNWLPLGGFVRMKGEDDGARPEADSFAAKGLCARFCILFAGVFLNWWLAAAIFTIGFLVGIPAQTDGMPETAVVEARQVQVIEVLPNGGADQAGIRPGDYLLSVDGQAIGTVQSAQTVIAEAVSSGRPIVTRIQRDEVQMTIEATPTLIPEMGRSGLGVALANTGIVRFSPGQALVQGVTLTWGYTKLILGGLWGLVRDLFVERRVAADVSGPVGIAVMTGQVASQGMWALLQFAALLSINLAIINALPIPALDGGRILFVMIEAVRRKKVSAEFEGSLHRIGFILLLTLVAIVTIQDLRRFGGAILRAVAQALGF